MACGAKSLQLSPHCCCTEWTCPDFAECLHCTGTTTTYTSSQTVTWPTDAIAAECKLWGRGGNGGDSSANQGGGGGGGGGFQRVIFQAFGSPPGTVDLDLLINDAANNYHTEIYQGTPHNSSTLMGVAYAGNDGANSPAGAGGLQDTTHGTGDIGINAMTLGACTFNGGNGGDGVDKAGAVEGHGGGGGGGAGSRGNGNHANGQIAGAGNVDDGGDGGNGDDLSDPTTDDGENYGGGGAGSYNGSTPGDGGDGKIEITWWYLAKLDITISGAPHFANDCDCPNVYDAFEHRVISWDNLDGNYTLEQDSAFSNSFTLVLIDDCANARTDPDRILIDSFSAGDCSGSDEVLEGTWEYERYVSAITVSLICVDGRMEISSLGVSLCQCARQYLGGSWGSWNCVDYSGGYPAEPDYMFICDMTVTKTAPVCALNREMASDIDWPDPYQYSTPCGVAFDCTTPTTGEIIATVVCD